MERFNKISNPYYPQVYTFPELDRVHLLLINFLGNTFNL